MNFYAHQKVSFVDYPGKISTLLFVSGCNFFCEYCHNYTLQKKLEHTITEDDIIQFLNKKKGKIDAIVITGGEPALYSNEILNFFSRIKNEFPEILTKFDTNGSFPEVFKKLKDVTDFVAMDFKSLDYSLFSNISFNTILESLNNINLIKDYEIRITMYPPYIKESDFEKIADILKNNKKVVLQQYVKQPFNTAEPYPEKILYDFATILKSKNIEVEVKI